jgi:PAS domain S-box-containing protein
MGTMTDAQDVERATAEGPPPQGAGSTMRASQEALRAALAKLTANPKALEAIFADSPEALVAFDAQRTILCANERAEQLFGYGRGELTGRPTDVLLPSRFRQPDAPPMMPAVDVVQVELPGLRRDGTELQVEWAFGSTPTESGPLFAMTVRDRDAMDRANEALRASEERFRLLVEGVTEYAIFVVDPTGHVSSWNSGAARIMGYGATEIMGRAHEIFFTPEDRAAGTPRSLLMAADRDGSVEISAWRVRKDGTRFRASVLLTALRSPTGQLRGFAKITRDLTEKLQAEDLERRLAAERAGREAAEAAEARVRASEERLRRLQRVTAALSEAATLLDVAGVVLDQTMQALDASGGAVYALSMDGRVLEMLDQRNHPELGEFVRLPIEMSSPLTDAVRERRAAYYDDFESCAALYPALREAIRSGGFEASVALPLQTHGAVLGVLGIRFRQPRTFSERDRALLQTLSELCGQALERARLLAGESKARADAESANRSKDEFLAMLGHELRNPLAPIVTALSLMKLRGGDTHQKERAVIERQVAHLVRLVDDLLDVSRITKGKVDLKKERVELSEVVARGIELSSPLLEQRRQHLSVAVPDHGLELYGDATRLAQVVSNLVTNAAKYTPSEGHIAISAWRRGDTLVLAVRDDGMGIAPEMLPRVFDLFAQERQSIDRSLGGLGLGLAIARSVVTMHEGTVSAASEGHEKGSTFTVELPAAGAADASAFQGAAPPRVPAAGRRRVLVVDDNADAAELLGGLLRSSGHEVMIASDGPQALDLAGAFRPEVALLDIGLPVMDGYELARRLRSQLDTVRLIAVTGYGQDSDRERSRAAGFDAHMIKPVDPDVLEAALD